MATESVSRLLDENADLKPLATRLAYIKRLQRRYRSLAPERLAEASRVCAIDGTTVVICATSGPVAAALRHLAPRLLEGFRDLARKSSKHSDRKQAVCAPLTERLLSSARLAGRLRRLCAISLPGCSRGFAISRENPQNIQRIRSLLEFASKFKLTPRNSRSKERRVRRCRSSNWRGSPAGSPTRP